MYSNGDDWENIANQYKKELECLHEDIENAIYEISIFGPKSINKGLSILKRSLDDSYGNCHLIGLSERHGEPQERQIEFAELSPEAKNCFEGIL